MFSKGSVLVVDDEINLCRILGAKLAKSGYSVVAVHDGQQAIDKVRESDFDVVLLDLILPKLDGLSALEQIRRMNRDLPVIVMTACGSAESLETARMHGVSAYINKPFDLDSLVELVQSTSGSRDGLKDKGPNTGTVLFSKDQPIVLEVLNGKTSGIFASLIVSRDERTVSVLAPAREGATLEVPSRTPVRVGLGANEAFYSFNSYVLSMKLGQPPVMVLDKPGVIYRTQRRQSERFPADTAVRFGRVESEDLVPEQLSRGRSCDISAGGIRIIAAERLQAGDLVYLETEAIAGIGAISAVAEVLRSRQEADQNYSVSMRFRKLMGDLGRLRVD